MVSVIVPVYKAEAYLHECVKSILNQTYRDIEVVLVDDGSPDNCPQICDEYAELDSRVRVVHQSNGGVASARNLGVREAKGEWLAFVDSDDFIDSTMFETLLRIQERTGANIVSCGFTSFVDGELPQKKEKRSVYEKTFSSHEAVADMFASNGIGCNPWCKIYHRDTFHNIQYPTGVLCEDKATTYKVYLNALKIVHTSKKLYYYRLRNNSIMGSRTKKMCIDTLQINEDVCDHLNTISPKLYMYACGYAAKSSLLYYALASKNEEMSDVRLICTTQIRKYYRYIKKCTFLPLYQKLIVYFSGLSIQKKDSSFTLNFSATLLGIIKWRNYK